MPRLRRTLTVAIPYNVLAGFRRRAKKIHPREAYGILLGRKHLDEYTIEDIHYPRGWEDHVRRDGISGRVSWWREAELDADWQNINVLGDIHSHPFCRVDVISDCAPSHTDLKYFDHDYLQGVMAVTKCKDGVLRTRCHFWLAGPHVLTVILR